MPLHWGSQKLKVGGSSRPNAAARLLRRSTAPRESRPASISGCSHTDVEGVMQEALRQHDSLFEHSKAVGTITESHHFTRSNSAQMLKTGPHSYLSRVDCVAQHPVHDAEHLCKDVPGTPETCSRRPSKQGLLTVLHRPASWQGS